jgi:lysophospholipase L1-like esterase
MKLNIPTPEQAFPYVVPLLAVVLSFWWNPGAGFLLLPVLLGFYAWRFFRTKPANGWAAVAIGNALLSLLFASAVFAAGESYYRFIYDSTDTMTSTLTSSAWDRRHVRKNNDNVRDNIDYADQIAPGKRRVTFIGASVLAGYGIKNVEDRFANLVRRAHPEWEIHVFAIHGIETSGQTKVAVGLGNTGYQIDQVVVVDCVSDIAEMLPGWIEAHKKMAYQNWLRQSWLCRNSYFFDQYYQRWQIGRSDFFANYFSDLERAYNCDLWNTQQQKLRSLNASIRSAGGRMLVVTTPIFNDLKRFRPAHEKLDQFWKAEGVPHLDLLPAFENIPASKLVVSGRDAHPNEYAHAIAAQQIDAFLKREIR